jgi:hypothetical protein
MRAGGLAVVLLALLSACASPQLKESEPAPESQKRSREAGPLRISASLLFPVNVAPDMVSNTVGFLFNAQFADARGVPRSNLYPVITMFAPIWGPVAGVFDAAGGYPFWDPVALDVERRYWFQSAER